MCMSADSVGNISYIANYTHAGRKFPRILLSVSASDLSSIAFGVLFTMKRLVIV